MKKVMFLLVVALLIPGILNAACYATLGVYFDDGKMSKSPSAFIQFDAFLILKGANYYVVAVEYAISSPTDPGHTAFICGPPSDYPDNMSVNIGDPFNGHSISFWPPIDGFVPGYNLLLKMVCYTTAECWDAEEPGPLADFPIVIVPHPETGHVQGVYFPDHQFFPIIGLTSTLCPKLIATMETSWGAIKNLYE